MMALGKTFQTGSRQVKVSNLFHQVVRKHGLHTCSFALNGCRSGRTPGRSSCVSLGESFLLRRRQEERSLRLYCSGTTQEGGSAGEEAAVDERQELLNRLDIRTGKILSVTEHEEADSLFIESIDVGDEDGPRTIVSGLKPYMPASDLEGKECVVLCNLKPRNMRGVKSHGMLLCASDKKTEGEEKVELLSPPQGTPVGERLCFGKFSADLPEPDGPNKIQKKKIWEKVQEDLQTDSQGGASWQDLPMVSSVGQIKCKTLKDSNIS